MSADSLHEQRVLAAMSCRVLANRGLAPGVLGHVSVRVGDDALLVRGRGREEQGIVEPGAEYDRTCEEITDRLMELKSPAGEPIVAAVYRREELFSGPLLGKVPDLIVEFADYQEAMENSNLPETSEFAEELAKLCDAPPSFRNLDLRCTYKFL